MIIHYYCSKSNQFLFTPKTASQVAATKLGTPMEDIEALLRAANPKLSHLSAPDGHIEHDSVLEALIDDAAFTEPALQWARLLTFTK